MEWNVYEYNINCRKIQVYNIFSHGSFNKEVKELLKKDVNKEVFEAELDRILMYYFWSKAEHEIAVSCWFNSEDGTKIDVYSQVKLNWEKFVNYVWNCKIIEFI